MTVTQCIVFLYTSFAIVLQAKIPTQICIEKAAQNLLNVRIRTVVKLMPYIALLAVRGLRKIKTDFNTEDNIFCETLNIIINKNVGNT